MSRVALSGSLSLRGRRLIDNPTLPEYLQEHFARRAAPFHPQLRPSGYIPLCIAENKLVGELLLAKLDSCGPMPEAALGYDSMLGSLAFRQALARFMGDRFLGRQFEPEQLAVLAGAGSVLEILFHVLADAGEGVLVPTPSYAGFWPDLETRDALAIVPVHTSSQDGFHLHTAQLDEAIAAAGRPVRALLFTSPDNPTGRVYSASELETLIRWAEERGIHLVMDEIYALSVFGQQGFISAASLRPLLGERVHIVWAFSKDFGMSGARVGVLVSENEAVIEAVSSLSYWACCSGPTQHLLGSMIADEPWVDAYLDSMRRRLQRAYDEVCLALDEFQIPYFPASAGFFVLLDLRRFLASPTWEGEHALWQRILQGVNVNLTPGAACRVGEPGFMRLCFAGIETPTLLHAVRALGRVLAGGGR
ncbi:MAG TPA: aminotransferase class I/II-fold pyridoxal phosphate-dependent enzyme [Polyangiaceae bacterium]|nr:aminotransferase class I/II-fold pyridoxal phosphate-dependent enzyme [Polyangiaceae bacterium]